MVVVKNVVGYSDDFWMEIWWLSTFPIINLCKTSVFVPVNLFKWKMIMFQWRYLRYFLFHRFQLHFFHRYSMCFFLNCPNVLHMYNGTEYRTYSLVLVNSAMMCLDMEVYILFCCCHTEKLWNTCSMFFFFVVVVKSLIKFAVCANFYQ